MLTRDCLVHLFKYVDPKTRLLCKSVCRSWNDAINSFDRWPFDQHRIVQLKIVRNVHLPPYIEVDYLEQHPFDKIDFVTRIIIQWHYVPPQAIVNIVQTVNPIILKVEGPYWEKNILWLVRAIKCFDSP